MSERHFIDPRPVIVVTAFDEEREAVAVSEVLPGHKFPIVWVRFPDATEDVPWPFESLRYLDEGSS